MSISAIYKHIPPTLLTCTLCSGLQIQAEFDHKVINHIKVDDGYTALHVAAHMNYCDQLYFLAAIVRTLLCYNYYCDLHYICNIGCV